MDVGNLVCTASLQMIVYAAVKNTLYSVRVFKLYTSIKFRNS